MSLGEPCNATPRVAVDVSALPTYSFTQRSLMWWGTLGFIAIETAGFGLAIATYLYFAQCIAGILPLIVRVFEFRGLNVRWDSDAYGSIVWLLLGLHTTHLVTDVIDTIVLTALMFTRHGYQGRRFSDVNDNAFYWDFVVISWLPLYFILYWFPRLVS